MRQLAELWRQWGASSFPTRAGRLLRRRPRRSHPGALGTVPENSRGPWFPDDPGGPAL